MFYTIYNLLLTFNVCSNNHSWCPPNFKSIYIYLTLLLSYGNKHVCKMAIVLSYAVSLQKFYFENSNWHIFFVIYLEMILIHAYRTFHILNFGSCIMKINNIWRKLWLNNIKRCFWQIFKISGHAYMFCYMPENHCKLTNSQIVIVL